MITESSPFAKLKKGDRAKVVSFAGTTPCCLRLQELGLVEGTEFNVVKVAPLGDPIEIEFRHQRICVRKCECAWLQIEVL